MDKREQYIAIIFLIAMLFFVFEFYYNNYNFFHLHGLGNNWFVQRVRISKIYETKLLKSPYLGRLFILILLAVIIFMSKVKNKVNEKDEKGEYKVIILLVITVAFIFLYQLYNIIGSNTASFISIAILNVFLVTAFMAYASQIHKIIYVNLMGDRFQKDSRKFEQFKKRLDNEFSVNIKSNDGWINIVNPFRASQVVGTPGSGKSYSFIIEAIIQHIEKGFSMLLYDYKFPDLSLIAYNTLNKNYKNYSVRPQFCIINFDDLKRSNRCNPLQPDLLLDPTDATQSAQALMYGLYPKWAQKQGEFFSESSINFVAACIWSLKNIENGRYCTLPHLIQFIALSYDDMFKILQHVEDDYVQNVISPFLSAWQNNAVDQLEGQIGTTRIALSRLTSPYVYWIMTPKKGDENEISLQINDPKAPKILCLSNNPDKQKVYGPILSLYNTRLMSLINKKHQNKTAVIIDELPTLSFPPGTLDNLIATARSNKIAVWLGFQDFAQLTRDLGKEIAEAIINTVGNTFSGMVNFDTAKKLSEKFGKLKVKKESITTSKESTSVSYSTQMDDLIPPSEISSLEQGVFVGQVADDRGYEIEQKIFYSKVLIDIEKRKELEKGQIPEFVKFDRSIKETIGDNFKEIKNDIKMLVDVYSQII